MQENDKIISLLNRLIEVCKDGEKGYIDAAESIWDGYSQVMFLEYARQRKVFASELQATVRILGGQPARKGNAAGTLHRGWMNVRSAFDRNKSRSIALECKRGECEALKCYQEALQEDLPSSLKSLLEEQYYTIQETEKHVEAMLQ